MRAWRKAHPDYFRKRFAAQARAYYVANRQDVIERARLWAINNPEKHRAIVRRTTAANSQKNTVKMRLWRQRNPDKVKAAKHRRRTLERDGSWTAVEWATLKRQYGHRCVGCWKTERDLKALGRELVPDHIIPVVKGGLNHITNIQPLCHGRGGCNNRKGKKYIDFVIS
jgi:hypothetical protein